MLPLSVAICDPLLPPCTPQRINCPFSPVERRRGHGAFRLSVEPRNSICKRADTCMLLLPVLPALCVLPTPSGPLSLSFATIRLFSPLFFIFIFCCCCLHPSLLVIHLSPFPNLPLSPSLPSPHPTPPFHPFSVPIQCQKFIPNSVVGRCVPFLWRMSLDTGCWEKPPFRSDESRENECVG